MRVQWRMSLRIVAKCRSFSQLPLAPPASSSTHAAQQQLQLLSRPPTVAPPVSANQPLVAQRGITNNLDTAVHQVVEQIRSFEAQCQWQHILSALDQAHAASGGRLDPVVIEAAIYALGNNGVWKTAVAVLEHMRSDLGQQPTAACFSAAMHVCTDNSHPEEALELFADMNRRQGPAPTEQCYDAAISAAAEARQSQTALNLLQEFQTVCRRDLSLKSYNTALLACSRAGQWQAAFDLLHSLPVQPEYDSYKPVLHVCAVNGQQTAVNAVLKHAQLRLSDVDVASLYKVAIQGFVQDLSAASQLFTAMKLQGMKITTRVYDVLLGVCEHGKHWQQSLDYLQQMKTDGLHVSPRAYGHIIHALTSAGQLCKATALRQEMRAAGYTSTRLTKTASGIIAPSFDMAPMHQLDKAVIRQKELLQKLSRESDWKAQLECLNTAVASNRVQLDRRHFNAVLTNLVPVHQWQQSLSVFAAMTKQLSVQPNTFTFNSVIRACATKGRWKEALSIFNQLGQYGLEPDTSCYNALIDACGKGSQSRRAVTLLKEMRQLESSDLDWQFSPDSKSYKFAIKACEKGDCRTAVDLFNEMKLMSLPVPREIYLSVAKACIKSEQLDKAASVLNDMYTAGLAAPSKSIYHRLLNACAKRGDWQTAADVLLQVKHLGDNSSTEKHNVKGNIRLNSEVYCQAMKACAVYPKSYHQVFSLYDDMLARGLKPKASAIATLIRVSEDCWPSAFKFYYDVTSPSSAVKPTFEVYEIMIAVCYRHRKWQALLCVHEDMIRQDQRSSDISYRYKLEALAYIHGWRAAYQSLIEERAMGRIKLDARYHLRLLRHCTIAGMNAWEAGSHITHDFSDLPVDEQGRIVAARLQLLNLSMEFQLVIDEFQDMLKRGLHPTVEAYGYLIRACHELNKFQFAYNALSDMRAAGFVPDDRDYDRVLQTAGDRGHYEEAIHILQCMKNDGLPINQVHYDCIIRACGKARRWSAAVGLLSEMTSNGIIPDQRNYKAAILSCAFCGQWETALKLYREMLKPENNFTNDIGTHIGVMDACSQAFEWHAAVELLDETESLGLEKTLKAYNCAIRACAYCLEWQRALELFDEMQQQYKLVPDVISYNAKLIAYGRSGMCEEALTVMDEMRSVGIEPNSHSYAYAISSCVLVKDMERAHALFREMSALMLDVGFGEVAFKGFSTPPDAIEIEKSNTIEALLDAGKSKQYGFIIKELNRLKDESGGIDDDDGSSSNSYTSIELPVLEAAIIALRGSDESSLILKLYDAARRDTCVAYNDIHNVDDNEDTDSNSGNDDTDTVSTKKYHLRQVAYCAVIDACGAKKLKHKRITSVLTHMQEQGISPNIQVYEAAISAYCKRRDMSGWKVAYTLLNKLLAIDDGNIGDTFMQDISDNTTTINTEQQRQRQRQHHQQHLQQQEYNAVTSDSVVSSDNTGASMTTYDSIKDRAAAAHVPLVTAKMFASVMAASTQAKYHKTAVQLLDRMQSAGIKPDVGCYTAAIAAHNCMKEWSETLTLFKQCVSDQNITLTTSLYNCALAACNKQNEGADWEASIKLFDDMDTKDVYRNETTYGCAMHAFAIGKQWQQAIELLNSMPAAGLKPNILNYNTAMLACGECGQWQQALEILDRVENNDGEVLPTIATYNIAIKTCQQSNQLDQVASLRARARKLRHKE